MVLAFVIALTRILALTMTAPVLSRSDIPSVVKIGFAMAITLTLYPQISDSSQGLMPTNIWYLAVIIFREIVIGSIIGYLASLLFDAITTMAQVVGVQMSQSAANVFDPSTRSSLNPAGIFYSTTTLIMFLMLNGHHTLLAILAKSFNIFPLAYDKMNLFLVGESFISVFNLIFIIGVKFMLPIVGAMLIADVIVAIIAKIMPQANMYFLLMPQKVIIATLIMGLGLVGMISNIGNYFDTAFIESIDSLFY